MLFALPHPDVLYDALLSRDPAYDGRAYVGVSSTGVFCRLTCPARKPKRQNCMFYDSVGACLAAGYRACKRCHPLAPMAQTDPTIQALLAALDADPARRWQEADVVAAGFETSTVRRIFKRQFGMTFLEMARIERLRLGAKTLASGGRVIDAQMEAGFDGASAFRNAFSRHLGLRPSELRANARLQADWIDTPLGAMIAVADRRSLYLLEFSERAALPTELRALWNDARGDLGFGRLPPVDQVADELQRYFSGEEAAFAGPYTWGGTPFSQMVWQGLRDIPVGETRSYGQLAAQIGRPDAVRAVARANGANRLAIVVPCHRLLGVDGTLTGYGGGLWRKQKLIEIERKYSKETPT